MALSLALGSHHPRIQWIEKTGQVTERFQIGSHRVDLASEQVFDEQGTQIELRVQAFAVLRHLLLNRTRLVTKDELMAAIWPHAVVTDDSLVQAVGDLRRALGDTDHQIIRTVRGRGYRLRDDVALEIEPERPGGFRSTGELAASPQPESSWRRFAPALLVTFVAAIGLFFWQGQTSSRPTPSLSSIGLPAIAVLRLRATHDDEAGDAFAQGFAEDLAGELARSSALRVISSVSSFRSDPAKQSLAEIGDVLQAEYLISGQIGVRDERMQIKLQMLEAATGSVIWAMDETTDTDGPARMKKSLFTALSGRVQRSAMARAIERVDEKHIENLDAYELTMRVLGRKSRFDPDQYRTARQEADRALAIAPDYAPAWVYLGYMDYLDGQMRLTGERSPADFEAAAEKIQRGLTLDPAQVFGWLGIASVRAGQRRHDEALTLTQKAIEVAPSSPEAMVLLGKAYTAVGRLSEAREAIDRSRYGFPLPPSFFYAFDATLKWAERDFKGAIAAADACLAQAPFFAVCRMEKIASLTEGGQLGISGEAHHFTGLRDVLKLFGQIQQANFMGNDFLVTIDHEGCLLRFQ